MNFPERQGGTEDQMSMVGLCGGGGGGGWWERAVCGGHSGSLLAASRSGHLSNHRLFLSGSCRRKYKVVGKC